MEQKTKALKTSGKVIAILMKVGYIMMLVTLCASAVVLLFMAITGRQTSVETIGGMKITIAEASLLTTKGMIAMCIGLLVTSGFLLAIFLLAHRMFNEISTTGDPFVEKHVQTIRIIGALVVSMTIATGVLESVAATFLSTDGLGAYFEAPGIVVGVILFCLSYIIEYGCALKEQVQKAD